MISWQQIWDRIDSSVPATPGDDVFAVASSIEPATVVACLQEWFGSDDARSWVRVVIDDVDAGMLERQSLYELSASVDRGGLGSGDYPTLPGISTNYVPLRLACTTAGCQVRVSVVSFNPDNPPSCPQHHTPLILAG